MSLHKTLTLAGDILRAMAYNGYGKRPLWQWILLYIIIGGAIYALIYFFFFAGKGGYSYSAPTTYSPTTNTTSGTETQTAAHE